MPNRMVDEHRIPPPLDATPADQPQSAPPRVSRDGDNEEGVASHVIVADPQAHRELLELCASWHRRKPNSMYVDWEQTIYSYRQERANR